VLRPTRSIAYWPIRAFTSVSADRWDAGEEFVDIERFGHVVVDARVEGDDFVGSVTAAGQYEDRHIGPAAQTSDHLEAVHIG
jgi:hypothetical protein